MPCITLGPPRRRSVSVSMLRRSRAELVPLGRPSGAHRPPVGRCSGAMAPNRYWCGSNGGASKHMNNMTMPCNAKRARRAGRRALSHDAGAVMESQPTPSTTCATTDENAREGRGRVGQDNFERGSTTAF